MRTKKWVNCPECNHKLFLLTDLARGQNIALHAKCPSCKAIVEVQVKNGWMEAKKLEAND